MSKHNLANIRVGLINKNNYGSSMEIIQYNKANDIWVKFEKGEAVHANWDSFINGKIRNVYDKSAFKIGYLGEGEYKTGINGKHTPQYITWHGMLKRCYDEKYQTKQPTYKGCYVCNDWLNFQNFAKWFDQNYYEIKGKRMELDKDILIKDNKVYSPDTCIFVPQSINSLFIKRKASRGDLPIGVHWDKARGKYKATCEDGNGNTGNIGRYDSIEEAFAAYKVYKEQLIKSIAKEYRERIPTKLYEVMLNYTVNIND